MFNSNRWQFVALLLIVSALIVQCDKGESFEEDGGEEDSKKHFDDESHKAEKGHHSHHSFEKGEKGSYDKEDGSHHFDEENGHKKGGHDEEDEYGDHHEEKKGSKGITN